MPIARIGGRGVGAGWLLRQCLKEFCFLRRTPLSRNIKDMPPNQNIKKVSKVARLLGETCNQRNMRTDITKILQCVFICFDFCLSGTLGQEAPIRFSRSFTLDAHKNITSVYHNYSNEKGVFYKVLVFLKFRLKIWCC